MRSELLLIIILSLLAVVIGFPGDGDKGPDTHTGGNGTNQPKDEGNQPPIGGGINTTPPNNQTADGKCICFQYYLCHVEDSEGHDDIVGSVGEECPDYLDTCCTRENILTLDTVDALFKPRPGKISSCGNRNFEGISLQTSGINDSEAQYGEFPWMVAVIQPHPTHSDSTTGEPVHVYQCGGSLIHPRVVLTVAHCLSGKDNLVIRAGEWDTQTKNELYPTQDRRVSEVIVHELFDNRTLANDVALLILEDPVDMTKQNVGLICLPDANESMDGRICFASGWGKDMFGKYSAILSRVDLPTVPRAQCLEALRKTRLTPRFNLHESYICAGGQPGKDYCKVGGGGPLVCPTTGNSRIYLQAGITAWGVACGTDTPGAFVDVSYFVNWINDKMQSSNIL